MGGVAVLISLAGSAPTLISLRHLVTSGTPSTTTFLRGDGAWSATGDMLKSAYDANANGVVDNAEALGGTAAAGFPKLATTNIFTGSNQFALGLSLRNALGNYTNAFNTAGALGSEWSNGTSTYATGGSTITVASGVASTAPSNTTDAFAYLNAGTVLDGTLQADLTRGAALMLRHNGAGSGYQLLFYQDGSIILIKQTSGQTDVQLYNSGAGQANANYRVVMTGSSFAIYQNTTLMTTVTDATYPSGYVGIYLQPITGNSIDNVTWTPPPAPTGYTGLALENGVLRVRNSTGQTITVGQQETVRAITAATTLATTDDVLNVSTSAGAFTQPLPSAAGLSGKNIFVKKVDASTNALTLSTVNSQTIDGQSTYVLNTQYAGVEFTSDGSNWSITALALPGSRVDIYGGPSSSGSFTWTKPTWATAVRVVVIAAGGGGGSGRKGAAAARVVVVASTRPPSRPPHCRRR